MTRGDRLGHSWRDGRLLFPGLASDFACMIRAALALYEATGERSYLDQALAWQAALDRHYANPDTGGYFLTADDAEGLVIRPAATTDDATPNPNGIAAQNLMRLAALAGDDAWREKADRLFEGVLALAGENLFGHASLLNAIDMRLRVAEIVVTGRARRRCPGRRRAGAAVPQPRRAARAVGRRAAGRASGAGQDRRRAGGRGLRLRRRDLLAAGDGARAACRGGERNADQLAPSWPGLSRPSDRRAVVSGIAGTSPAMTGKGLCPSRVPRCGPKRRSPPYSSSSSAMYITPGSGLS